MLALKKFSYVLFSLIGLIVLTSCSKSNQTSPTSQYVSSSQSANVSSESGGSSTIVEKSSEKLDGTYKGMDEEATITLVIKGESGAWTEQEPSGEEEVKPVSIDPTNQRMRIGDDTVHYMINNRQLTIEDIEQENGENDTVVLTKQ
ncbi:Bacterial lipoprotein [Streptococcus intermedius]|uniref:Bacterial lipoprotein n=1 Tax=Streptococcus intermedius TaxID=1338 RepID=A0AAE8FYQ1_STRIT|nr:SP_0198 family lipoprotein [Streptococcus intermedius]RSJ21926.1 Bacterial lipoprotein [Streptococcus intermedius]